MQTIQTHTTSIIITVRVDQYGERDFRVQNIHSDKLTSFGNRMDGAGFIQTNISGELGAMCTIRFQHPEDGPATVPTIERIASRFGTVIVNDPTA